MARRSLADIDRIRGRVNRAKRLSDRIVGIGPFGVGLDGIAAWVPVAGPIYSAGAAAFILWQALQLKAPPAVLARMAGYLLLDTASSGVWGIGSAIDFFFPGHLMAGKALLKHVERTHYVEMSEAEAKLSGHHARLVEEMRAAGKKRLEYLHD